MNLKTVTVRNFRSIKDQTLELDDLTALVGANGAGKSAFVKAIELFQSEKPQIDEEDYHTTRIGKGVYAPDTGNEISIKLEFVDLTDAERDAFPDYASDGRLVVERVFKWDPDQKQASDTTYGYAPQEPDFDIIKQKTTKEAEPHYNMIREKHHLDPWDGITKARNHVMALEKKRSSKLQKLKDDGKSFRITGKKEPTLSMYVRFILVPAVRDASDDAVGKKDSAISQLTEELTRTIRDDPKFTEFRKSTMEKYARMMDDFEDGQLKALANSVAGRIRELADDVGVDLTWADKELPIDVPGTRARLAEGGIPFEVKRVGHGSQRAFIIAMLQEIAANAPAPESDRPCTAPTLILVIEEPELYQHPIRQRHMARVFADLAKCTNKRRIQILYTTHSPHFVGMDRIGNIRLIKKEASGVNEPVTVVRYTGLTAVKNRLHPNSSSVSPADASLADKLRVTMTPWLNEGFFANLVVLVEGDNDYAAILGAARSLRVNFEKIGVSVIPCGGKNNIDKPLAIFTSLGITTYVVWDADKWHKRRMGAKHGSNVSELESAKHTNKKLLEMLDQPPEDWPSGVHEKYTCFEDNLNSTMRDEIGKSLYSRLMVEATKRFDVADEGSAEKKSLVMVEILEKAQGKGRPCKTLCDLVKRVERLACDGQKAWARNEK